MNVDVNKAQIIIKGHTIIYKHKGRQVQCMLVGSIIVWLEGLLLWGGVSGFEESSCAFVKEEHSCDEGEERGGMVNSTAVRWQHYPRNGLCTYRASKYMYHSSHTQAVHAPMIITKYLHVRHVICQNVCTCISLTHCVWAFVGAVST